MYSFLLTFTTFKENNMITLEDYKSKIISHRTLSEEKVRKFKEGYDKLEDPKAIFGDLEIPEDFTLKHFTPEAYESVPSASVYREQYIAMCAFFDKLNACIDVYVQRAAQADEQFKAMQGG